MNSSIRLLNDLIALISNTLEVLRWKCKSVCARRILFFFFFHFAVGLNNNLIRTVVNRISFHYLCWCLIIIDYRVSVPVYRSHLLHAEFFFVVSKTIGVFNYLQTTRLIYRVFFFFLNFSILVRVAFTRKIYSSFIITIVSTRKRNDIL